MFAIGAGPVTGLVIPEISSSRTRGKIMSFSFSVHWVCNHKCFKVFRNILIVQCQNQLCIFLARCGCSFLVFQSSTSYVMMLLLDHICNFNCTCFVMWLRFVTSWLVYSSLSLWRNLELHPFTQALVRFPCWQQHLLIISLLKLKDDLLRRLRCLWILPLQPMKSDWFVDLFTETGTQYTERLTRLH